MTDGEAANELNFYGAAARDEQPPHIPVLKSGVLVSQFCRGELICRTILTLRSIRNLGPQFLGDDVRLASVGPKDVAVVVFEKALTVQDTVQARFVLMDMQ